MSSAGVAARLLGAGGKALGWAGRHPIVSNAGVGAGVGFLTSGFSGWGAIAGGVGGAVGGSQTASSNRSRLRSQRQDAIANVSSLRKKLGVSNFSMREGRSQLGAIERGYTQDSITLNVAREDWRKTRGSARESRMRYLQNQFDVNPPGIAKGNYVGRSSRNLGAGDLSTVRSGNSAEISRGREGVRGARAEFNAARVAMKTSAGDLSRMKGQVGQMRTQRKKLGRDLGIAKRKARRLYSNPTIGGGIRGFSGGAIGGAIGGGAVGAIRLASGAIGSSYGSQNQNPYGATFSGMGNGAVGGY